MRNTLRFGLVALGLSFFFSCNQGGRQDTVHADSTTAEPAPGDSASTGRPVSLVASHFTFFSDTIPCRDCPGTVTALSLETDSTCIWIEQSLEKGSFPILQYGRISQADSLLTLYLPGGRVSIFRVSDTGMRIMDVKGMPRGTPADYTLEPNPAGFIDFSQPYQVEGRYFFKADGATFTPAGQAKAYPVNPGKGSFDAERIFLSRSRKDTGDLCLRAIVRIMKARDLAGKEMTMAHIDKVLGRGVTCK